MTGVLAAERAQVCAYAQRMAADRLVVATAGNVSMRAGDLVAVTPTGVDYATLTPDAIPVLDLTGYRVAGDLLPTSEVPMHLAVYRAARCADGAEVAAIVHTHAVSATAVSTLVAEVPPIHYVIGALGGSVRVAPYATYGTPELAEALLTALRDRDGCLLANHGTVTIGRTLAAAYERTQQLEWLCRLWLTARTAGEPRLLPADEIALVTAKLRGYGQPDDPG